MIKKIIISVKQVMMPSLKLRWTLSVYLLFLFSHASFAQKKPKEKDKKNSDSLAITEVVTSFYKWEYDLMLKGIHLGAFSLISKDNMYIGIDYDSLNKNITVFKNSVFFDKLFFVGYEQLAAKMDYAYKNGPDSLRIHDGPPNYGIYDGSISCNCQDIPESPEKYMFYDNLKIVENTAEIWWGWKGYHDKVYYYVKLRFDNNQWKITNLMGLDEELKKIYIK